MGSSTGKFKTSYQTKVIMDKGIKYILISLLLVLVGLNIYTVFFGKQSELNSALKDLKNAREEIAKTQQNLDSILKHSQIVLDRNEDFKNYIHAVDSIVKSSDAIGRRRELKYLQNLGNLERKVNYIKSDLAKMNEKLPEPENGELSNQ